jgi:hypothetical protein
MMPIGNGSKLIWLPAIQDAAGAARASADLSLEVFGRHKMTANSAKPN